MKVRIFICILSVNFLISEQNYIDLLKMCNTTQKLFNRNKMIVNYFLLITVAYKKCVNLNKNDVKSVILC